MAVLAKAAAEFKGIKGNGTNIKIKIQPGEFQLTEMETKVYKAELKGLLAAARKSGESYAIIDIPINMIAIDERYQDSSRTERSLNYLMNNWDEHKLLPITVIPHDEEGLVYAADGFARGCVMYIKGYLYAKCMVILDAPTEKKERLEFEAYHYAYQNRDVAKLTPVMKHSALRILGDKTVIALDKLQKAYGFEYVRKTGQRSEGVLGSYSELFDIVEKHGVDCGKFIFDICSLSGFNVKANGYATYVLRALKNIYALYPNNRSEICKFLGKYLKEYEPVTMKANAVAKYNKLNEKSAVLMFLEDLLYDNLHIEQYHIAIESTIVRKIA